MTENEEELSGRGKEVDEYLGFLDDLLGRKLRHGCGGNGCIAGTVMVNTPDGNVRICDIKEGQKVWTYWGWSEVLSAYPMGRKKVKEYRTDKGSIVLTPNHNIISFGRELAAERATHIDAFDTFEAHANMRNAEIVKVVDKKTALVYSLDIDNVTGTLWANGFNVCGC